MSEERKVAIVTGAGHGIGRAIAKELADAGWLVVAADRDTDRARAVAADCGGDSFHCDVSREEEIVDLVAMAADKHGRIDAVVSNAGISEFAPLADLTLASWNRVLATNLTAAFLLAKHAEASLRAAKGAMVLIASTRAHMSEKDTHAYSASKGGLVALAHSLAVSLGPDVRVNCVSPGWIDVSGDALSEEDHAQHPAGRVGRPEDVAGLVSWLLSDRAGFVTGAEFAIDGGMTRKMIYV